MQLFVALYIPYEFFRCLRHIYLPPPLPHPSPSAEDRTTTTMNVKEDVAFLIVKMEKRAAQQTGRKVNGKILCPEKSEI